MSTSLPNEQLAPAWLRLANDLRSLAEIVTDNPGLADVLVAALALIHVHIPAHSPLTPHDLTGAVLAADGQETAADLWSERWYPASSALLPDGLIQLVATQMREPGPIGSPGTAVVPGPELDAAFEDAAAALFGPQS